MDENKWEEISEVQTDYIDSARSEITDDTDISFLTVQVFCCESCISDITHCKQKISMAFLPIFIQYLFLQGASMVSSKSSKYFQALVKPQVSLQR